jgi:hypothetical protein
MKLSIYREQGENDALQSSDKQYFGFPAIKSRKQYDYFLLCQ